MSSRVSPIKLERFLDKTSSREDDLVVVEEPLEIRIGYGKEGDRKQTTVTLTMRTPGDDEYLCIGFAYSEGIITSINDVLSAKYCTNHGAEEGADNVIRLELAPNVSFNPNNFIRNFYTNSSCGVCGKASIEQLKKVSSLVVNSKIKIHVKDLKTLPNKLELAQDVFNHTGGVHACGLFNVKGDLVMHKEDVGRHNALDKLVGNLLITGKLPSTDNIVVLSGRISYELVQKCVIAGIPFIAAVGAPSSLSIELAKEYNITLVGFLKESGFNVYSGIERVIN